MSPIRYTVTPADPRAHLFTVRCEVEAPAPRGQEFRLPAWIRGSYLVRDLAKHVVSVSASAGGQPVAIERLDKSTLRCAPCSGPLALDATVYAFDESVRKAYLDARRGFFNGTSLFYAVAGQESAPVEVELRRPAGPDFARWRAATAMTPAGAAGDGFGLYRAHDYEEAIDHPVELGEFERIDFDVDGIPHAFILSGRFELDRERLARDTARICVVQREWFGHEPKLDRYLFLTRVVGAAYGGLEHRASAALICSRNDLPRLGTAAAAGALTREYRGFLGLVSHEYFHLWNVKRITAESFARSTLAAEAYTTDLWHYEGVTSYYDDRALLKSGVIDAAAYLDLLAETATRLHRTPGRLVHSLAESSFETWLKYYQPDENTPNATVSYYIKGALAALCLDLQLRLSGGVTLDDVMRELWRRYGREGKPVPERGLEQVAQELSRLDLGPKLDQWLRSTAELPLRELLAEFGVEATLRAAVNEIDGGGRTTGKASGAWLGLRLRPGEATIAHVLAGSPAQAAGLSGGDQLVALDGLRVTPNQWSQRLLTLTPGREYGVHFFRGDELHAATLTAAIPPLDTWTFTLADDPGALRLERRKTWLGS